ncbi:Cro/C1-type HTH DNA-binding domain-containing protein [Pseudobutyrivibrio sp. 49]|uniref:helix-turn-helix transcriptional regulator n=1 Tax=unclassified Pseudobutyrivibrio TaxID=2638619 RepID=UPI000888FF30|nr:MULTISPECIES: helix-turn-helix transcriptional regulator [unclassified Pseudobutyrivibrio]SDI46798.1 Cro/C1-type HTH DNA-binding domain-containing protein [Pseudobutyrivibrio sp. 49]SFO09579.1 Cro/C1-type HTH DNA-binding domain-containing protein [Pseudobutyrivibrio sp. UC1225]
MNDKFIEIVKSSGKTAYRISKETGIPYTTVNELCNGKTNINNAIAETVLKLAIYLECNIDELLNDFSILDGYAGKYKGYSFKWKSSSDGIELLVKEDGQYRAIYKEDRIIIDSDYNKTKEILTKVIIDAYDEQAQAEKLLWEHII